MRGSASYHAFTEIGNASEAKISHEARVTFTKHAEHVPWHGSLSPSTRNVCHGMGHFHLAHSKCVMASVNFA